MTSDPKKVVERLAFASRIEAETGVNIDIVTEDGFVVLAAADLREALDLIEAQARRVEEMEALARKSIQAASDQRARVRELETIYRRLDLGGLGDKSRLVVMDQNPSDHWHWTRPVGEFTAGEVRQALKDQPHD